MLNTVKYYLIGQFCFRGDCVMSPTLTWWLSWVPPLCAGEVSLWGVKEISSSFITWNFMYEIYIWDFFISDGVLWWVPVMLLKSWLTYVDVQSQVWSMCHGKWLSSGWVHKRNPGSYLVASGFWLLAATWDICLRFFVLPELVSVYKFAMWLIINYLKLRGGLVAVVTLFPPPAPCP